VSEPFARRAWRTVEAFEAALCEYTGAPYAVTVNSCTSALFLSLLYYRQPGHFQQDDLSYAWKVWLPKRTYVGVGQAALNAGYQLEWVVWDWERAYALNPLPVFDSAKNFHFGMYGETIVQKFPGEQPVKLYSLRGLVCVSFQAWKTLPIGQGGAILTHDADAAQWLRRARFDGRDPEQEDTGQRGWHMYLSPPEAARGLWLLHGLPGDPPPLRNDHVDISGYKVFKEAQGGTK